MFRSYDNKNIKHNRTMWINYSEKITLLKVSYYKTAVELYNGNIYITTYLEMNLLRRNLIQLIIRWTVSVNVIMLAIWLNFVRSGKTLHRTKISFLYLIVGLLCNVICYVFIIVTQCGYRKKHTINYSFLTVLPLGS